MNNEILMLESGSDDGFSAAPMHKQVRLSASQILWTEEKLADIREGRLNPEMFKLQLARRDFGGATPFLRETMTTSDFPLMLLANIADRALLAGYNETPSSWPMYTKMKVNNDLKASEVYAVDGGEAPLGPVLEGDGYDEGKLVESKFSVRVRKFGRKFRFSLEAFLNDGLNAFDSMPARMGRAARRTQETIITLLYATDAAIAAIFTTGNRNKINVLNGARVNNPPFSLDGIIDGLTVMSNQLDAEGQPISIEGVYVVYPTNLEGVAMHLQHLIEVRSTVRAGDTSNLAVMTNPLDGRIKFVPNSQLQIVGGTNKATGWFMFQDPNVGRPAIVAATLLGHPQPELFVKAPNSLRIGGGAVAPTDGDFDTDSIEYKVRMWFGGTNIDPKSIAYSNGTGA